MPSRSLVICSVVACLVPACGKTSLVSRDAGRDTSPPDHHVFDAAADGGTDAPGRPRSDAAIDVTPDAGPLAGRYAFDVTVKLTFTSPPAAGAFVTFPTSAMATLVLDTTAGWLVLGGEGQGSRSAIAVTGTAVAALAPVTLYVPFSYACNGVATLQFSALNMTVGVDGRLHGTASGTASYIASDTGIDQALAATLDGVPDTTRPALPIRTAGVLDPLAPARFAVSEPLPAGAKAQLVAADGGVVELVPEMSQTGVPAIITAFRVPSVLPFGASYRLALD